MTQLPVIPPQKKMHDTYSLIKKIDHITTRTRTHTHTYIYIYISNSTAQGGGGSFKNRKPIGEVGCCESRLAERIH